jgi:hypothetical protein
VYWRQMLELLIFSEHLTLRTKDANNTIPQNISWPVITSSSVKFNVEVLQYCMAADMRAQSHVSVDVQYWRG